MRRACRVTLLFSRIPVSIFKLAAASSLFAKANYFIKLKFELIYSM